MRVAVFVDAGYLYSAGAIALTGSAQNRTNIDLKQQETISKLEDSTRKLSNGAPLLRIYWYDGLLHGGRSREQEALANADNVKVRLGTVTGGRQKGVDSLIVTDLIELARNHAISDAVLLSGDEDLRIGVQIAQSFGVRVHLLGIEPCRGNQSDLLREEADTTNEWSKDDVEEVLSVKSGIESSPATSPTQAGPGNSGDGTDAILNNVAIEVVHSIDENELPGILEQLERSPHLIPPNYDSRLLSESRRRLGRDLDRSESPRIRDKFMELVKNRTEKPSTEHGPGSTT